MTAHPILNAARLRFSGNGVEKKLTKFEIILEEISDWLSKGQDKAIKSELMVNFGITSIPTWLIKSNAEKIEKQSFVFGMKGNLYRLTIFDPYISNPYVAVVCKKLIDTASVQNDTIKDGLQLIKDYKSAPDAEALKARDTIIFWMLFLAALEDEIYNNELDSIIDIAYCMDFNEDMVRDWCHAVEYVMQGNRFKTGCDFECETTEGKRFFLHKKDMSSSVLGLLD